MVFKSTKPSLLQSKWSYYGVAALFLITFGAWIACFTHQMDLDNYLRDVNVDDSFYYFTIARNIALGHGSTFDGIHLTNGYHPLWTAMLVPVFWAIEDPASAVVVIKSYEFLLIGVAALLVLSALSSAGWECLLLIVLPFQLLTYTGLFLGVEAAPHLLVLCSLLASMLWHLSSPSQKLPLMAFSLTLALVPWVRLESISLAAAVLMGLACYRMWRRDRESLGPTAIAAATCCGSLTLYLCWNQWWFDSAVPISGRVKSYFSTHAWEAVGGYDLLASLRGTLAHRTYIIGLAAGAIVLLVVAMCWWDRRYREERFQLEHGIDIFLLGLALAHLARFVFSVLWGHPQFVDYSWYFVPAVLLTYLIVPVILHRVLLLIKFRWSMPSHAQLALVVLGVTVSCAVFAQARRVNPWSQLESWRKSNEVDWSMASYEGATWLNEHVPPSTKIGATDAGVLGFFSHATVVNLDGLANSSEYFVAMKNDSVRQWLAARELRLFGNVLRPDVGCAALGRRTRQEKLDYRQCEIVYRSERTTPEGRAFTVLQYAY